MLTSESIKAKAKELGAAVCGIGRIYEETNPQRDPRKILPNAKCIIGFFCAERALQGNGGRHAGLHLHFYRRKIYR